MRRRLTVLTLLVAVALEGNAAARRRVALPADPDTVTITFTDPGGGPQIMDAMFDVGTFSQSGHSHGARVTRQVVVRIDRTNRMAGGTASLRASLQSGDGRCIIRINGVVLGTTPALIDANAPIGSPVTHRMEIEVPAAVSEGAVVGAITWEVATH